MIKTRQNQSIEKISFSFKNVAISCGDCPSNIVEIT